MASWLSTLTTAALKGRHSPFLCVFLRYFRYTCHVVLKHALVYRIGYGEIKKMTPAPRKRGFFLTSGHVVAQR